MTEKRKIRFGIFHRVLLTMVLVAVLPLVAVWYANSLISSETLGQTVNDRFTEGLAHLTYHVDSWVENAEQMTPDSAPETIDPIINSVLARMEELDQSE